MDAYEPPAKEYTEGKRQDYSKKLNERGHTKRASERVGVRGLMRESERLRWVKGSEPKKETEREEEREPRKRWREMKRMCVALPMLVCWSTFKRIYVASALPCCRMRKKERC